MSQFYPALTDELQQFLEAQKIFFVATAAETGSVNLSPKGLDSLRVINPKQLAWLNLTGSGNETAAHVQINPRMTVMCCAFEGEPLILRLYGSARALHNAHPQWSEFEPLFPSYTGSRQIFILDIERVQTSCGWAGPLYEFQGDRTILTDKSDARGQQAIEQYWLDKNRKSIDGFETNIEKLSGASNNEG